MDILDHELNFRNFNRCRIYTQPKSA